MIRKRQRETDRDRHRQTATYRDRQRQTETDRDRQFLLWCRGLLLYIFTMVPGLAAIHFCSGAGACCYILLALVPGLAAIHFYSGGGGVAVVVVVLGVFGVLG